MNRLPLVSTILAVLLLAASIAYWALQLYQPPQRPIAAPPPPVVLEPAVDAAATLFGGQQAAVEVSNYALTGVVSAGRDSVAIVVAEGKPPVAIKLGREIVPGVVVQEVHPRYVMISEGGVAKRVDLPQEVKPAATLAAPVAGLAGAAANGNMSEPVQTSATPAPPPQPMQMPAPTRSTGQAPVEPPQPPQQ
ncbi:hypothetical protein E4L96_08340 [Massilia arenosa]|uniref:Type II secretion system protein GspC N-terminal domain-containing protein n=1 Tax=Zemynaea arenosa TaxID=2561931 RepID=A0A4Y9SFH1_9BURK|nr:hypothetical protein [Massilia arenosa]TFW22158.1 hypothetical protein E4L96_08340 [Massilia arenosa]